MNPIAIPGIVESCLLVTAAVGTAFSDSAICSGTICGRNNDDDNDNTNSRGEGEDLLSN